jgi:hypothetical protein
MRITERGTSVHSPVRGQTTMFAEQESDARSAEPRETLAQAIERRIVQRTSARLQALEVEVTGDRVIVRGRAPTYHVKQLALKGVLDVIESVGTWRVEPNIRVGNSLSGPRTS